MRKKMLLFSLTFFTVILLGAVSYAFQFFTSTSLSIHQEIERNEKFEGRLDEINFEDGDPISILVIGLDTRKGETGGRADSLVLLTINPKTKSMHMVSIPRDTYTKIKGAEDKINSAYQVGGTEMTLYSVENLLDVPVDYYVKVNMKSFTDIVDAVGGVEVNNDFDFTYKKVHFKDGKINLNGKEALLYTRMRKLDPDGDFGRQKRQRQVIEAVVNKGAHISSLTKFSEIVNVVEKNVKTNLNFKEMWEVQSNYRGAQENLTHHKIGGKGKEVNGTYYYFPDEKKLQNISDDMQEHLELDKNQ